MSDQPDHRAHDATPDVRIVGLRKVFESHDGAGAAVVAVDDVHLSLEKGQLVTLLGPSGCGKTTLLRMIAGFEEPTAGDVYFGDRRVNDVPPNTRDAAMVFQSYAIFPHLSVFDNVAFGLRLKRISRAALRERVDHVIDLVGLRGMQSRAPSQLSGGQQQRVALARCIVMEPRLLLFDEPLSNLDAKLREQMRLEIRELQQRLGITSVYVTHDQVEAMALSDLIVVMNEGRVEQIGAPVEVYARPTNRFVADFIGKANLFSAQVAGARELVVGEHVVRVVRDVPCDVGSTVEAVVRPEAVGMGADREGVPFRGVVRRSTFLGTIGEVEVELLDHGTWLVDVPNAAEVGLPDVGSMVALHPSVGAVHVLPHEFALPRVTMGR